MSKREDLIPEIKRRLRYDPLTGKCYWIALNRHHPRLTGKEAGTLRQCKGGARYYIKVNRLAVPLARIAFVLMIGRFPEVADHINGDTQDNRWSNLREVTSSQNSWNIPYERTCKKSGLPIGVRKLGNKYQVRIAVNKKTFHLGVFDTIEQAQKVYLDAKKKYHGEFARPQ